MHQKKNLSPESLLLAVVIAGSALFNVPFASAEGVLVSGEDTIIVEPVTQDSPRYLAAIELHSASELRDLMERAEQLVTNYDGYARSEPVAFVLNGPELKLFARHNYEANRDLIDTAARLEAFGVVDFKACTSWMANHGIEKDDLPAFIDYVSSGRDEVARLQTSGYAFF